MDNIWTFISHADKWLFRAIVIGVVGVFIIQAVHYRNKDLKEDKVMAETTLVYQWPEVFDTKELGNRPDAVLCADGLMAWGLCHAGNKPHPNFGEVMAKIAMRLGISSLPESFMEKAKEYDGSKRN